MNFDDWATFQWPHDYLAGLRVGQSYLNNVRPTVIKPELFYCKEVEKAWDMIMELEQ